MTEASYRRSGVLAERFHLLILTIVADGEFGAGTQNDAGLSPVED
jgi:hypothetical protein